MVMLTTQLTSIMCGYLPPQLLFVSAAIIAGLVLLLRHVRVWITLHFNLLAPEFYV